MKNFTRLFLKSMTLLLLFSTSVGLWGQTTLISPAGAGGFELGSTLAANGWTAVNDATTKWVVGTVSTPSSGANTAFVSNDNGVTNAYTNTLVQVSYFYRDVTVPAGEGKISLSFKWKNTGESSFDRIFVFTGPTTLTPVANSTTLTGGTDITGTTTYLSVQAAYQTATYTLPASLAGTTFRLIFGWRNDGSGGGPLPGTVDDISLTSAVPATYSWTATTGSASWATAASWSPARTTPDASDVLQFNAGGSSTVTGIPVAQTVAQVVFSNNTTANFQSAVASTLTMGNLTIPSGSTLISNGTTAALTLAFSAGAVNPIGGRLEVSNGGVANGVTFTNGVTTVTGTLAAGGTTAATLTGTSLTTLLMNGTYEHKYTTTGGAIPTATWGASSNCNIIGYTTNTTATSGFTQNFANFTWNCPAQTGAINLSSGVTTGMSSTFTVTSTGTGSLRWTGTGFYIINANNFTQTGGTFDIANGSSGTSMSFNVSGTFSQSGGTFSSGGTVTCNPTLQFNGTSNQAVTFTTVPTGPITYRISNAAGITLTGPTATFALGNGTLGGLRISTTAAAPVTFAGTSTTFAYNAVNSTLTYDAAGSLTARATEFPATSGPANLTIAVGAANIVTVPFSRSLAPTGASGILTMTSGDIDISSNTLTLGTSAAFPGTLTYTAGNVRLSTGSMVRWFPTTGLPLSAVTTIGFFPIASGANNRNVSVYFSAATAISIGGTLAVSHNGAGGLTALSPTLAGTPVMDKRTNATWTFAKGNGFVLGNSLVFRLTSGNLLTSATPANLQVILATPALASGVVGTNTGTNPNLQILRSGITDANVNNTYAIGAASADVTSVFNSVASGNWSVASTWDVNAVPTSTDVVNITAGTNVSLDGANVASSLTINAGGTLTAAANSLTTTTTITNNGTINATGGTITATGASTIGIVNNATATMIINGGTVNVGPAGGSFRRFTNLGTLTVSSGTLNVNGNFVNTSSTGNIFTQSGGNVNIDGNAAGVAANSVATGTALAAFTSGTPTTVFLTGGTFTIVDPHAVGGGSDYALSGGMTTATNASTNHTFRFGDGVSTDAGGNATNGFLIWTFANSSYLGLGTVIANGGTGTNRFVTTTSANVGILGDLTINANSEYRIGSTTSYFASNIINNGTLTNANTIILGSYASAVVAASTNAQTISGSGVFRNVTTGSTASMVSLTVNNTNATGVTLATPLSISGTLTMTSGLINTTSTNLLQVGTATASGTISGIASATNMVVGPLARTFAASRTSGTASNFPVGKSGVYAPFALDMNVTSAGSAIFVVETFATNSGTAGAGVTNLSARNWSAVATSGFSNVSTIAVQGSDVGVVTGKKLLQAPSAIGAYDGIFGGSSTSGTTAFSTLLFSAAANYTGYFAYGDLATCTAPGAPTGFNSSLITTTSFTGTFTAPSPAATGYLVVRYAAGATPTQPTDGTNYFSGTLGTGTVFSSIFTTTFNATGLTPAGTIFDYYIYSFNNTACAGPTYTTMPLKGTVTTCATVTNPATALVITTANIGSMTLTPTWTASTTIGVTYELDVATNSSFTAYVPGYQALNVGTGITYAITGLSPSTTYYTRVRAVTGGCYSINTTTLTTTTVAVPTITALSPNVCNGPATLTITGTGLLGATAANVTIGGTPVTAILTNTAISITATVAAGVSGVVSVTNAGGVAMSATPYSVSALGVVTVTPSVTSFCGTGGATDLVAASAYSGYTYAWTPLTASGTLTTASGATTTATLTATTDFQVVATDAGTGCTETVVTSIGVYPFPSTTMTATPNDSICLGSMVTLNSGLSAGNFSSSNITHAPFTPPASAVSLVTNGVTTGSAGVALSGGSLDDGGWSGIPIGFTYKYFGAPNTTISVGTNGTLMFGTPPGYGTAAGQLGQYAFVTTPIAFPNTANPANVIANMARDNDLTAAGSIKYWTTGYAPNRKFIVAYIGVPEYSGGGTTTSQVVFYETTGDIEIHCTNANTGNASLTSNSAKKIVGLQDVTKVIGATTLNGVATTVTNTAWRFSPPSNYTTTWSSNTLGNGLTTPATTSNEFTASATPTTLGTKTYQIVFTNQTTGCSNSATPATIAVEVLPTPVTPIVSSPTVCSGSTATLTNTATLGATDTVKWYGALTGGTPLATGNTFTTPSVSATRSYFAETNNVACTNAVGRLEVIINISAPPTAQAMTGGGTFCTGTGVTGLDIGLATSESGVNYQLKLDGVNTGSPVAGDAGGAAISFGLQGTGGTYTVLATNAAGCTATMTGNKVITISGTPTASVLAGNATVCLGNSTNLNVVVTGGAGPYSVVYNNGTADVTVASYASGANIPVSPTANTTYTLVSVTSSGSCPSGGLSGTATVNVNAKPTASVLSGVATVCSGTPTNLSVDITGGTSPYTVVYSGGTVSGYVSAAAISVSPTTTRTYTLTSVTDANGCTSAGLSSTAAVTVNPTPSTAVLTSSTVSICATTPINLNVAIAGGTSPYTVVYSDGMNQTVNGYTTGANIPVTVSNATNYSLVSVTDANGCVATTPSGAPMVTITNSFMAMGTGMWNTPATWSCGVIPTATTNVTIPSAYVVTLDVAAATINDLTFTDGGKLQLGANTLTANGTVTGNATAGYVVTDGAGALKQTPTAATAKLFPVGSSTTSYDPLSITPATSVPFAVTVKPTITNTLGTRPGSTDFIVSREWDITPTGTPGATTLAFTADAAALNAAGTPFNFAAASTGIMGHWNTGTSAWDDYPATYVPATRTWTLAGYTGSYSPFIVASPGAVLAVEFTNINAQAKGTTNEVTFTTATEKDVKAFSIERSINNKTWDVIGTKVATGGTSPAAYSFTDNAPAVLSYYRVRSFETSGKGQSSKVVAVKRNGGKLAVIAVSPMPTVDEVNVDFSIGKTSKVTVMVMDIVGKVVKTETFKTTEGANAIRLNLSNLAQGTYIMTLNDGETMATQRIVKQ